jgi:hypothetical protein
MGAEFGHVARTCPAAYVARRAGDAGSSPHLLGVWGSLGTLGCAQLTHGAALRAVSHHPIGVS